MSKSKLFMYFCYYNNIERNEWRKWGVGSFFWGGGDEGGGGNNFLFLWIDWVCGFK